MAQNERKQRAVNPIVNLRLPAETLTALQSLAKRELGSVSQIVRRAVAEYLDRQAA